MPTLADIDFSSLDIDVEQLIIIDGEPDPDYSSG
ncbi:hypothetical protein [Klebsiella quasipneumoniae]|nr:hypothetical protein [Klebsiella quasipneumoniae]